MNEPVLTARHLSKSFGPVEVLHDIAIDLRAGEVHAILGENGAGKSTLMKILAGVLAPSGGEIRLDGRPLTLGRPGEAESHGLVLIHQEFNLADDLNVEENIFLGRELRRGPLLDRRRMRDVAAALLADLDSPIDPTTPVRRLSVSQKQMVEIAKAVSREVRVLFMDEPTDVLTGHETEVLFRLVRELTAKGVAVVFVSHKLDEIEAIADRVTILRDGHHVVTEDAAGLSPESMARLMVGRDLSDMYPPKTPPLGDEVVLRARDVVVPGFVERASFALHRGEILGFAGLIGAGRTELFEGLLGLRPSRGRVELHGRAIAFRRLQDAKRAGIAYVSEDRKGKGLIGDMELRPNLTLASLERFGHPFIDRGREQEALAAAVREFDIRVPRLDARAGTLSGGNQQKLVLAKVMQTDPDIVVLDEPTRGIDVGTKREIYFYIRDLVRQGKSCVLISSELPELIGLADRVVVMRSGRVTGTLGGDDINEQEIVRYATGLKRDPSDGGDRATAA